MARENFHHFNTELNNLACQSFFFRGLNYHTKSIIHTRVMKVHHKVHVEVKEGRKVVKVGFELSRLQLKSTVNSNRIEKQDHVTASS